MRPPPPDSGTSVKARILYPEGWILRHGCGPQHDLQWWDSPYRTMAAESLVRWLCLPRLVLPGEGDPWGEPAGSEWTSVSGPEAAVLSERALGVPVLLESPPEGTIPAMGALRARHRKNDKRKSDSA